MPVINTPEKFLQLEYGLGKQEIEVLRLLTLGYNRVEIADKRFRSFATIDSQIKKIMFKLKAQKQYGACIIALQVGLVKLEDIKIKVYERI